MLKSVLTATPTYTMSCFLLPVSLCKRIQSVLTRFWWDDPKGKKKICWVSWDKLTQPKSNGGLGFRDIQLFNQALLAKIAWRIMTVPNCLLARILVGKYCHKQSFATVSASNSCSHGWRGIIAGRNLLQNNVGKAVGNGSTTHVWRDSWISLDTQLKPYGPIEEAVQDLVVADLLTSDLEWNTKRIREVLPGLATQIQCLQPSKAGGEDKIIWLPLPSGVYSTRSGYNSLAARPLAQTPQTNVEVFEWVKDVWKGSFSPKMKMFLWSIIQNALPLGENLQKRGLGSDLRCVRCKERETKAHIFFNCPYAKEVWNSVPLARAVHIAADESFTTAITKFREAICLPPTGINGNVLPWICWAIWTSRNTQVFENRLYTPAETATKGLALAKEWNLAQQKSQTTISYLQSGKASTSITINQHQRPRTTCNTDAAWDKERKKAGLAWTFSGSSPIIAIQDTLVKDFVGSPLVAEALAMKEALSKAVALEISDLKVYTDCTTLLGAINGSSQRKEIIGVVSDIRSISTAFASIIFLYVPRSENTICDSLAKTALRLSVLNMG